MSVFYIRLVVVLVVVSLHINECAAPLCRQRHGSFLGVGMRYYSGSLRNQTPSSTVFFSPKTDSAVAAT